MRQTGGKGQYGHVVLTLEPLERGTGFELESKIVGGAVPREYWRAIEAGVTEALAGGVVAGYPVVDIKVTLVDGSYHEVDSSEMAFKIAGCMAAKDGVAQGRPGHPRADHEGRGHRARGFHGRRDRQPEQQARHDRRDRRARHQPHDPGARAAGRDVRLRHRAAQHDPGSRDVLDGVQPLRGSSHQPRQRADRQVHRANGPIEGATKDQPWQSRSSTAASRTSTWARSGTSTTARPR